MFRNRHIFQGFGQDRPSGDPPIIWWSPRPTNVEEYIDAVGRVSSEWQAYYQANQDEAAMELNKMAIPSTPVLSDTDYVKGLESLGYIVTSNDGFGPPPGVMGWSLDETGKYWILDPSQSQVIGAQIVNGDTLPVQKAGFDSPLMMIALAGAAAFFLFKKKGVNKKLRRNPLAGMNLSFPILAAVAGAIYLIATNK